MGEGLTRTGLGEVALSRYMNLWGIQCSLRASEEKGLLLIPLNWEKAINKPAATLFLWLDMPGYGLRSNREKQPIFHQEAYFQFPKGLILLLLLLLIIIIIIIILADTFWPC